MQTYQITDLEQLTGIKAHTIRIWEKRYKIIEPFRTKTNIRYYNNDQARKLLNISTLIQYGYKISKIADMNLKEQDSIITLLSESDNLNAYETLAVNALVNSTLQYDEVAFEKTYSSALNRLGMKDTMLQIIYPFLKRIGIMWSIDDLTPAQEHFATTLLRRKLFSAIDGIEIPTRSKMKFILFLPPNEWHEIGLLFTEYLLRINGAEVINLGQNVPVENLSKIISATDAKYIFTFFVVNNKQEVYGEIENLLKTQPNITLFFATALPELAQLTTNQRTVLMNDPKELLNFLSD
ncbi:MAG: MerR family transcriptional regulator [Sphingobacteriaceae bacterium]|nr:MerR family transcriptional regulator [Sphingobacteriaceae bacterium]